MIYKLKYSDKESALIDLKLKEVIDDDLKFINGTEAVVDCGIIILTKGAYGEDNIELTKPVLAEGYHYDVMSSDEIVFESEILVNNPKYTFGGY
tara:strand:- start:28 stop:309 length:282 start_codon:yes stop_codon:yes gene_type:complete